MSTSPRSTRTRRAFLAEVTAAGAVLALAPRLSRAATTSTPFFSTWQVMPDRAWAGPEFWTNPLQDWRIAGGKLECIKAAPARSIHVLTRELGAGAGTLSMSVRVGLLDDRVFSEGKGSAGFSIAVQGPLGDYRHNLIYGRGLELGLRSRGELFIGAEEPSITVPVSLANLKAVELRVELESPAAGGSARLTLSAHEVDTGRRLAELVKSDVAAGSLTGNLALCANFGAMATGGGGPAAPARGPGGAGVDRWWFSEWKISGTKVAAAPERAFGPLCFNHYTLHEDQLTMSVQLPPLGAKDRQEVRLQTRAGKHWNTVAEAKMDPAARNAVFHVKKWSSSADVPYRLAYTLQTTDGEKTEHLFEGVVRRDPTDGAVLTVGDISCNAHFAFPNTACVTSMVKLNPDLLTFTGDQYYEASGGFGVDRTGGDTSILDVLRKWMLHGWTWREMLRDRPSISIPDDHDVYHGNLWGEGGAKAPGDDGVAESKGGYKMGPDFVNAVYRMQTSHHPRSPAKPGKQGIIGYYGPLTYGRVSFAILADRQYKSAPDGKVPPTGSGRADHVIDPKFDPRTADVPGLEMLGKPQMEFLQSWTTDWRGADMKAAISQTLFTAMATHHGRQYDRLIADYDTNAWPQTPRNAALRELRRSFSFHITGDQHLPAVVHYGIDGHRDGVVAFASPAVNNVYPRKFEPEGATTFTGDFTDSFGHPMTVLAYANAKPTFRPGVLDTEVDKACGFGVVRFDKRARTVTVDCWSLLADPLKPGTQFPGWPVVVSQFDNFPKTSGIQLPEIKIAGKAKPVVSVVDESNGETVYTVRLPDGPWRPPVLAAGRYTLAFSVPEDGRKLKKTGVEATRGNTASLTVTL